MVIEPLLRQAALVEESESVDVYPLVAPQSVLLGTKPYITYSQIGSTGRETLAHDDSMVRVLVSYAVWAKTRLQAAILSEQLEFTLASSPVLSAVAENAGHAVFDHEFEWYGIRRSYRISCLRSLSYSV